MLNDGLWTMDYRLWTMDYGLWTMYYGLWTMDYGLWTMDYIPRLYSLEVGLAISEVKRWLFTTDGDVRNL